MKSLIETAKTLRLDEVRKQSSARDITGDLDKDINMFLKQMKKSYKDLLKKAEKEYGDRFDNISVYIYKLDVDGKNIELRVGVSGELKRDENWVHGGDLDITKTIKV